MLMPPKELGKAIVQSHQVTTLYPIHDPDRLALIIAGALIDTEISERARILALLRAERQHAVEAARFATVQSDRREFRLVARVLKRLMREIEQ